MNNRHPRTEEITAALTEVTERAYELVTAVLDLDAAVDAAGVRPSGSSDAIAQLLHHATQAHLLALGQQSSEDS